MCPLRSEEHTSELQSHVNLVCRLLLETKKNTWSSAGSMSQNRAGHTATLLPSGNVLVAGGTYNGLIASAQLYDPTLFFFNDTATTEIYTLSLHDALPI